MSGSILLGLVAGAAVEQVPSRVDELVVRGGHVVLAVATVLPAVLPGATRAFDGVRTGPESDALPVFGLLFTGDLVWAAGRIRTARVRLERETTHLARSTAESLSHRLVFDAVAVLGGLLLAAVGFVLSTPRAVRLTELDSGLVVNSGGPFGEKFLPWRGVRRIETGGDSVRVRCRSPHPTSYRIDSHVADEQRQIVVTLRRCRRW
ncbi:hypothetical protein [Halogeometricum pallidum]|nr:hypothetical protein [Halogeometricum pallidum]